MSCVHSQPVQCCSCLLTDMLRSRDMHSSVAENARIPRLESESREAGSVMQAYQVWSIGFGTYNRIEKERYPTGGLAWNSVEHMIAKMWVFWNVISEILPSFHNFRMKSHPNPRAQKSKMASPHSSMYGMPHQGMMVKCCSSSHCPCRTSQSHPANSSHCCTDR